MTFVSCKHGELRRRQLAARARAAALFLAFSAFVSAPAGAEIKTIEFAGGAAEIPLDDAVWKYVSYEGGVFMFSCVRRDCPAGTILRLKSQNFDENEEKLGSEKLKKLWAGLNINSTTDGVRVTTISKGRRMKFGAIDGAMLRLRSVIDKDPYEVRLFWTPHNHQQVAVNFTTPEPVRNDILTRLQRATIPLLRLK